MIVLGLVLGLLSVLFSILSNYEVETANCIVPPIKNGAAKLRRRGRKIRLVIHGRYTKNRKSLDDQSINWTNRNDQLKLFVGKCTQFRKHGSLFFLFDGTHKR